jgi:hypothetical protein
MCFLGFAPRVSIQLISPASGDGGKRLAVFPDVQRFAVSIQLISPASGDGCRPGFELDQYLGSFHSINIPSEWGHPIMNKSNACKTEFPFN